MPIRVFDAIGMSHSFKQWMAIVIGGAAGVAGLVGITVLLHRRLFDARNRATSSFADTTILFLIGIQLVLGLGTIVVALIEYIDGCAILNFMFWAQDILTLRPAAAVAQVAEAPLIFKLHMINGMTIFLLLPFTRLVNIWSVPIWYLGRRGRILRPGTASQAMSKTGTIMSMPSFTMTRRRLLASSTAYVGAYGAAKAAPIAAAVRPFEFHRAAKPVNRHN